MLLLITLLLDCHPAVPVAVIIIVTGRRYMAPPSCIRHPEKSVTVVLLLFSAAALVGVPSEISHGSAIVVAVWVLVAVVHTAACAPGHHADLAC